jgi:anhydro-N-acetylmuramic acid kinase
MLLSERYVGLMSGTSCDGVDAVVADFANDRVQTLGHVHVPFSSSLREQLQSLTQSGNDEIERLGDVSVALARVYAEATLALLAKTKLQAKDIAALGAHGQTIRHRPERGFTLQINQPALIAELTGIAVVADFRSRDVAAGGQGAPLVPAFHAAVFTSDSARAIVNIGGIGNVSLLSPSANDEEPAPDLIRGRMTNDDNRVRGFDTGPGNTLLDAWCERYTGKPFDENGAWGASGRVDDALLAHLFNEPYFSAPPPKSTGRELFNLAWLDKKLAGFAGETLSAALPRSGRESDASLPSAARQLKPEDVQATLVALTAQSITREVADHEVFVCGGGVFNQALMRQIPNAKSTAVLGVDPMHVEALAFAWLAHECFASRPGNVPAVTGARGARILGAVYAA